MCLPLEAKKIVSIIAEQRRKEGKISSRSLMFLIMIRGVPINQLYVILLQTTFDGDKALDSKAPPKNTPHYRNRQSLGFHIHSLIHTSRNYHSPQKPSPQ
ncbi:hypothetical protein MTR_5g067970 [Medicago truncatula]|uniref:Uncharacterized protein n=1 Tax=Medicago truncatula TaxID=3880 RepID=G7KD90_MEDTR|nr:hypothetical protein MTR_5g067970 [Medicago truncatula]